MSNFAVFSDSSCDLPSNLVKENDIIIVPIKVSLDGTNKLTEGVNITNTEFYDYIQKEKIIPKTYFPTVKEYVTFFKSRLEQGQDVLCLCLSSKLSKSYYSALRAKEILMRNYKNNKIMIIDTLLASGSQGLLVLDAIKLRNASVDITDAYNKLLEIKKTAVTIFTINSLDQLARGGRMSMATATIASLLHINPIIHLDDGALVSKEKALGRAKAAEQVRNIAIDQIGGNTQDYDLCVFHSRSFEEAKMMQKALKDGYRAKPAVDPLEIGVSIGSHTGVSVVAISFMKQIGKM